AIHLDERIERADARAARKGRLDPERPHREPRRRRSRARLRQAPPALIASDCRAERTTRPSSEAARTYAARCPGAAAVAAASATCRRRRRETTSPAAPRSRPPRAAPTA